MQIIKKLAIIFLCFLCFSCATKTENLSYVDVENPDIIKKMAFRIVDLIQQEKVVENTIINITHDENKILSNEVLDELKARGFALSDSEGTKITITLNSFEENKMYLKVTMDKVILSRIYVYEAQTGVIKYSSPLSKGEV